MRRPLSDLRPIGPFKQINSNSDRDILEDTLGPGLDKVQVHFHSSENMRELRNDSVALMITSPPYNFGWDYGESFSDESRYVEDYLSMLARVFNEAYKKLMPEGRLAVNVPTIDKQTTEVNKGNIPTASDVVSMMMSGDKFGTFGVQSGDIQNMQSQTDWKVYDHIIWNKGVGSADAGLGSLGGGRGRPFRFKLDNAHESILIFQKPGKRNLSKVPDELIKASSLDKTYWTRDSADVPSGCSRFPASHTTPKDNLWTLPTTRIFEENGERVPSFPDELPRRLIKSFSFVGDVIVDPFAGAGTTLKVAKEEDRVSTGYDIREDLRPLIERRVGEPV